MKKQYDKQILSDYKTYKREMFKANVKPIDYDQFEHKWNKEADREYRESEDEIKHLMGSWRYV